MRRLAPVLGAVLVDSWRRPGVQLAVVGIVLVATTFVGTCLGLTTAARAAVVRELAGTPPAATVVVLPAAGQAAVPEPVEAAVRRFAGVAEVAPFATDYAPFAARGRPGDGEPWSVGVAVGGSLSRTTLVAGTWPAARGQAVVTDVTARRVGLVLGSSVGLVAVDGRTVSFVVTGIVRTRLQVVETVLVQAADMTVVTGRGPAQLDVLPAAGAEDLGARLAAALGTDAVVRTGDDVRADELRSQFGSTDLLLALLGVFGVVAAAAAALTTACAFAVLAERRRRNVELLRALGAGTAQVLRALLIDAALVGALGGGLGAALTPVAIEAVRLWVRVALDEVLPAAPASSPLEVLAIVLSATAATVAAALGPTIRVGVATGRRQRAGRFGVAVRVATAVLAAGATGGAARLGAAATRPSDALLFLTAAGVAAFVTVVVVGPVLLTGLAWFLGWLVTPFTGRAGRIARRSVVRAPARATVTAAATVLAALVLAAVTVGLVSLTASVDRRLASRFPAPVTVSAVGDGELPAGLAGRLAARPGVGAAVAVRSVDARAGYPAPVTLGTVDARALPQLLDAAVESGSVAALGPGTVVLDRAQAAARGVTRGSVVQLPGVRGPVDLRVVAVVRSSGVLPALIVDPADLPRLVAGPVPVRRILVMPAANVDVEGLFAAVDATVVPRAGAVVQVPADARSQLAALLALIGGVATALAAAVSAVAFAGIAVAVTLSVRRRRDEVATLHALGLGPVGIVATVGLEGSLLGTAGVLVGSAVGTGLAVVALAMIDEVVVVPVPALLGGAGVLVALAALVSTVPAVGLGR